MGRTPGEEGRNDGILEYWGWATPVPSLFRLFTIPDQTVRDTRPTWLPRFGNLPAGTRKALNASVPASFFFASFAWFAVEKQFPGVSSRFPVRPGSGPPYAVPSRRSSASIWDLVLRFRASWRLGARMGSGCDQVGATVEEVKHPACQKISIPLGARSCAVLGPGPRTEFRHDSCNTAPR